jgi:hypothetical protein
VQIDKRWQQYIGYQGDDVVEDRSLYDFWMANLHDLHRDTRVFSYDDYWPIPLRVPKKDQLDAGTIATFAETAHGEWLRSGSLSGSGSDSSGLSDSDSESGAQGRPAMSWPGDPVSLGD